MVEDVESFTSEFQPLLLSDLKRFGQSQVKVPDAAGDQCIASDCGSIEQSKPLDPVDVTRCDAQTCVWVSIPGRAELRTGRWRHNCAGIDWRVRIADVRPIIRY